MCEGYQYYDCIRAGFKNRKVPEGESYLVDSGSTECSCPAGGGNISCRLILCPEIPPHCLEPSDSAEACPHCLRYGCVYENQKFEAGHSFHMASCQVCHCPNDGGDLMCSVIPDCSSEMDNNPEERGNELQISKQENAGGFPNEDKDAFSSNSVPIYAENMSEFENSKDYDYLPEATASPDAFILSSVAPQTQNPHDVVHEDTRKELRETVGTYDAESREEGTKDSLNITTVKTDSRSSEMLSSQMEITLRPTQVPPRATTPKTIDDFRRPKKNPDAGRNFQHTIPELYTIPKVQFISTTSSPVNVREREDHKEPPTLGRYHQERNDLHLTSDNQRGE